MNLYRNFFGLFIVITISGCVAMPAPHTRQVIPEANGIVTFNQIPVVGAEVHLHKIKGKNHCGESKFSTKTDKDGKFYFKGNKDFRFFIVFGDPLETWGFCIKHEDKYYNGWTAQGIGYSPLKITAKCDLKNQRKLDDNVIYDGFGICEVNRYD
ncbi:hypothetical protein OS175_07115 [Marinicella sp. S1101]|uniref:DUF6795 domain-containing protein n=1 Tax=Marinicella marina TaxID=2996016 RepID=UPI002260FE9A|nr:DUF6795 domain-containing protein [Marinicella marina]MCX7553644.1 hypothetical protein [Marinicella marina]MDJ1140268.1 hypothetical protein [Marinicella marina]